jgi:hypothetical protein
VAAGDQFYVTHCTTGDSVLDAPGYSVRASVGRDPLALREALQFPPYELPLDMWKDKPAKADTPRRLARTTHPHGGVWVAHSAFLEKDTMGRDRSYFTHLLHLPASSDAASVLESWDAPGWVKEYPPGGAKTLKRGTLPVGEAISAASLTAFLSKSVGGPTDLSVVVCPERFRSAYGRHARGEVVGRFLKAYLLAHAGREAGGPRDRLFVHAEPGLVAMLLYAAARLLPPALTADLTFSTFEPAHRGLRDFKLAAVVGTYLGTAAKGLDHDLTTSRGYGLDTLHPERSSRELAGPPGLPSGVAELIDLAALGEWELLADVHRFVGGESDALDRVPRVIPLARAVRRLNDGTVTDDDLLTLKADRRGNAILTQKADRVWVHLQVAALANERLRFAFRDWLAEPARLTEYRREASEALLHGDLAGWDARWAVVREAADPEQKMAQADKARKSLDTHIPNLPPAARQRLRDACAESGAWPDHHLLAPVSPQELDALLAPDIPADYQGYTCFAVMGPDEKNWLVENTRPYRAVMRERVRRHLLTAPTAVLAGYIQQARPFVASDPVLLRDLFRPFRAECVGFLGRLVDAGADKIEAGDWFALLDELNVYSAPEWAGFLLRDDHLAKLLAGFKADPIAIQVWDWGLAQLTPALFEGDAGERAVYDQLRRAAGALTAAGIPLKSVMSPGGPAKLNGADTVLAVAANPASAADLADGELSRGFQAFGIDPLDGLRNLYVRGGFQKLDLRVNPSGLVPFAAVFQACYPVTLEYFAARTAVSQWLALSQSCPAQTRAEFQLYFVRECVPAHWHQETLDETRHTPFTPEAEARIREMILAARKPASERYEPPVAARSSDDEDAAYASPATRRAKKAKGRSKGGAGRRNRGADTSNRVVWIIAGVIAIVVAIIGVVIMLKK